MLKAGYAEFRAISNFSFLRGASHPHELVEAAQEAGYSGIGIADLNSLSGIVRAHAAAKDAGFPFFPGCQLEIKTDTDDLRLLAYPTNRESYGRLCRLLTTGKRRTERDGCILTLFDLLPLSGELVLILIPPDDPSCNLNASQQNFIQSCRLLIDQGISREYLSIALSRTFVNSCTILGKLALQAASYLSIPVLATGDVHFHAPHRKPLQDVLTCIRNKCSISQAGFLLLQNAERCLKPAAEVLRLFRDLPLALKRSLELAEMCSGFSLDQLRYEYPDEVCPAGFTPAAYLANLVYKGAEQRYPQGLPAKVDKLLKDELALIGELKYEKYFLTCYDIVRFARQRGILCQGRGAAANSAVCYCLGITAVDPDRIDLLFARFISKERDEPPDIDIDFEHERREEVIQYIYQRFGRERAGLTCEVITYRHRSAVREVGKALGLSPQSVDKLARSIHRWTACAVTAEDIQSVGLDPNDTAIINTFALARQLIGFPRHLSQHVGGFIICQHALCETVPIRNAGMPDRTIIEWDKDDIETLGMLKIDVLGLGMLTCIRKALEFINLRRLREDRNHIELHTIPAEDPAVYEMVCAADTVGVFQIESRAQMSMLPRLRPRCFYDLVIEVAIVRPGPIQGNMVHPFLKRRNGLERVYYPDARVEQILGKTMGVPIFQEQAMRLAIVLAQFSPGEAEKLRRAMAAWKRDKGVIAVFKERILKGMLANGYALQFAESCVEQIKGFSEYGFPESHAASFALLVYASSWIKCHYPLEFAAALLNSQPMGFYAPSQIVSDLKNHGGEVLPVDVNKSGWDCRIEAGRLRLGLRLVKDLGPQQAAILENMVASFGDFNSIAVLWRKGVRHNPRLRKAALKALARADAFGSMGLDSRAAFWEIRALPEEPLPIDALSPLKERERASLPEMSKQELMFQDYQATSLSLRGHPIGFIRAQLDQQMVSTAAALKALRRVPANTIVSVAGISIVRQRPHTARGVVFITLEDETGLTNLIIRPPVFEEHERTILTSSTLLAHGVLERVGEVVYVNVARIESLDERVLALRRVSFAERNFSY